MDDRTDLDRRRRAVVLLPDIDGGERVPRDATLPACGLALDVGVAGVVLLLALVGSFVLVFVTALPLVIWAIPTLAARLMRRRLRSHGLARLADARLDRATWVAVGAFLLVVAVSTQGPVAGLWVRTGFRPGDLNGLIVRGLVAVGTLATVTWTVTYAVASRRALRRRLTEVLAWQQVLDGEDPPTPLPGPEGGAHRGAAVGSAVWLAGSAVPASLAFSSTGPEPTLRGGRRRWSTTASVALIVSGCVALSAVVPAAVVVGLFIVVPWLASR